MEGKRVLVAMSGGVDSSAAALLSTPPDMATNTRFPSTPDLLCINPVKPGKITQCSFW